MKTRTMFESVPAATGNLKRFYLQQLLHTNPHEYEQRADYETNSIDVACLKHTFFFFFWSCF